MASEVPLGEEQSAAITEGDETGPSESTVNKVDALHGALSTGITASANWIDSFFRDERFEIEEQQSNLRLKVSGFFEKGETADFIVRGRLKLVLPNLNNKVYLFASSILEEDNHEGGYYDFVNGEDEDTRNFYLSLRYFYKATEKRNISLRTGLRFNDWSPAAFIGPRFNYSKKLSSWNFRFIEDVTYFSDNGWESRTSVDAETPLSDAIFFRTNLDGRWYESSTGYFYSFNTRVYQPISDHQALGYQLSFMFETRPANRMTEVLLRVRYRKRFWRDWLYYEISPQFQFMREDDYKPSPGIILSIEGISAKKF